MSNVIHIGTTGTGSVYRVETRLGKLDVAIYSEELPGSRGSPYAYRETGPDSTVKPMAQTRCRFTLNRIDYMVDISVYGGFRDSGEYYGRLEGLHLRRVSEDGSIDYSKEPTGTARSHVYKAAREVEQWVKDNLVEVTCAAKRNAISKVVDKINELESTILDWKEIKQDLER
jgi:hypothetical protein